MRHTDCDAFAEMGLKRKMPVSSNIRAVVSPVAPSGLMTASGLLPALANIRNM